MTLIEDDVYSELYFGRETSACQSMGSRRYRVALFIFFQMSGSRFSHWLGCGRKPCQTNSAFAVNEHIIHQFPMQLALVDYLSTRRYDAHLRRLRRQLAERKQQAGKPFAPSPGGSKIHHNDSGYFLWLELPEQLDAGELSAKALEHLISIAPGKCFQRPALDAFLSF